MASSSFNSPSSPTIPPRSPSSCSGTSSPTLHTHNLHSFLSSSCSDAADILTACSAVDAFLAHQPPDSAISFFRLCFPLLLQRLFGLCESPSPAAWIAHVADDEAADALRALLQPTSPLFAALGAIDSEAVLLFLFPNERLPLRLRRLLLASEDINPALLSRASPLLKPGRIVRGQLQLNLFEYYLFWFAYYGCVAVAPTSAVVRRRKWLRFGRKTQRGGGGFSNSLYLELLDMYLAHLVKGHDVAGAIYVPGTAEMSAGGVLLLTLVEFWLLKDEVDDPWLSQWASRGGGGGRAMISVIEYTPPGAQLCDGVRLLLRHCHRLILRSFPSAFLRYRSAGWAPPPSPCFLPRKTGAGAGLSDTPLEMKLLRKPVYKFLSCAFSRWPAAIPLRQARYLVRVWVDYMQPWNVEAEECLEGSGGGRGGGVAAPSYSAWLWQDYVTGNRAFYTELVARFLELALRSVGMDVEAVLEMTPLVLNVLAESRDLLEYLRKLEIDSPVMRPHGPSTDMDVSTCGLDAAPTTHKQQITSLFGNDAFQIFQMLILQAEIEIQYTPLEKQKDMVKALESLKDAGSRVFDFRFCNSGPMAFHAQPVMTSEMEDEHGMSGRRTGLEDAKYRGDWMRRPIETTEIAWLARALVQLSDSINYRLGLDRWSETCEVKELHVENAAVDEAVVIRDVVTFADLAREMKCILVRCWVGSLVHLRLRGWRVNLRFLARKPFALLLLLLIFYWLMKNV